MTQTKEKATTPMMSVDADNEQSLSKNLNNSLSDANDKINERFDVEESARKVPPSKSPDYMHTFSMRDLYKNVYDSRPPIVEGLLYSGTYLFVGDPKVGKSFFMAQLAYHISMGIKLWGYEVKKVQCFILPWKIRRNDCKNDFSVCMAQRVQKIYTFLYRQNNLEEVLMNNSKDL